MTDATKDISKDSELLAGEERSQSHANQSKDSNIDKKEKKEKNFITDLQEVLGAEKVEIEIKKTEIFEKTQAFITALQEALDAEEIGTIEKRREKQLFLLFRYLLLHEEIIPITQVNLARKEPKELPSREVFDTLRALFFRIKNPKADTKANGDKEKPGPEKELYEKVKELHEEVQEFLREFHGILGFKHIFGDSSAPSVEKKSVAILVNSLNVLREKPPLNDVKMLLNSAVLLDWIEKKLDDENIKKKSITIWLKYTSGEQQTNKNDHFYALYNDIHQCFSLQEKNKYFIWLEEMLVLIMQFFTKKSEKSEFIKKVEERKNKRVLFEQIRNQAKNLTKTLPESKPTSPRKSRG